MKYTIITPTRNERPNLLNLRHSYVKRMIEYSNSEGHIFVNDLVIDTSLLPIKPNTIDLWDRIKIGFLQALNTKTEAVIIIEDDDWYAPNHISTILNNLSGNNITGPNQTIYHNPLENRMMHINHPNRSSLCSTALSITGIKLALKLNYPNAFVDLQFWKNITTPNAYQSDQPTVIGIKHGIGKCGGKGHNENFLKQLDKDNNWLKSIIPNDDYQNIITAIHNDKSSYI